MRNARRLSPMPTRFMITPRIISGTRHPARNPATPTAADNPSRGTTSVAWWAQQATMARVDVAVPRPAVPAAALEARRSCLR